jgi:hypothetical protein
MSYQGL